MAMASSVYPSAGARATASVPMLLPPPGRVLDDELLAQTLR
jgi:hypothetical protein